MTITKFIKPYVLNICRYNLAVFILLLISPVTLFAQSNSLDSNYYSMLKLQEKVQPYSNDLFGDQLNFQSGNVVFVQKDIVLKGNGPEILIQRKFNMQERSNGVAGQATNLAADWDLEIPRISTMLPVDVQPANPSYIPTAEPHAKWDATGTNSNARCSNFASLRDVDGRYNIQNSTGGAIFSGAGLWRGARLEIPGFDLQHLLRRAPENTIIPNIQINGVQQQFNLVSNKNWMVTCIPQLKNNEPGEGFLVVSPDGTKYWFDWLIFAGNNWYSNIYRETKASLLVSRIEDKNGNYVLYSYVGDRLDKIEASDGRRLDLQWQEVPEGADTFRYIDKITTQSLSSSPRVWDYVYEKKQYPFNPYNTWRLGGYLRKLILPDGSSWQYALDGFTYGCIYYYPNGTSYNRCTAPGDSSTSYVKGTIIAPTGVIGDFTFQFDFFTRYVENPSSRPSLFYTAVDPSTSITGRLVSKSFSGSGLNSKWSFSYNNRHNSQAVVIKESSTLITNPDSSITKYVVNNTYRSPLEGQVIRIESFKDTNSALPIKTEALTYAPITTGAYPQRVGLVTAINMEKGSLESYFPVLSSTLIQDGVTFSRNVNQFDWFANATSVTQSNSLGQSKTDTITYENNLNKWVLGQVKTVMNTNTGRVVSQTDYDATTALPIRNYEFGLLKQTNTYNPDGTLASVKDANNNVVSLANYKRGIPQNITFPDNTSLSGVVNDNGWLTSTTDQLGSVTNYEYDAMGRMSKLLYPTGDTNAWLPTNFKFHQNLPTEAANLPTGVSVGQWRYSTWNSRVAKVTYFDGMLRPIVEQEWDWANGPGTIRHTHYRYDTMGRKIFQSYPYSGGVTDVNTLTGTRFEYDALGRITKSIQDSELGPLATTTEYLSGFQTKTTNPRGVVTRQGYQVFDTPDTSRPVFTVHAEGTPESKISDTGRDVFGKPLWTSMRDPGNTLNKGRWYVYDQHQRLCKAISHEEGATHYEYDAVGNVIRTAEGDHTYASSTTCDAGNLALANKTVNTYNSMNRLTAVDVPGGTDGDKTYTYAADGLVTAINSTSHTAPIANTYAYNKRRLLTSEASSQVGWYTWGVGYNYDDNGSLSRITYPTSFYVDYAPNALGQATQASSIHGTWATGIQYYPNGAVKQFTYGNGITHTMTQNARQLPSSTRDALGTTAITHFDTTFDANGNVANYNDPGQNGRNNRAMFYDNLDRLTLAYAPNLWGHANYQYDVLDNLKRSTLGAAGFTYFYDASNRLQRVDRDGGGSYNYTTNAKGEIINDGRNAYFYDGAGRINGINDSANTFPREGYRYDGENRRVLAVQPNVGNIISVYGKSGQLLYQQNDREGQNYEYIYLNDDLLAIRNCCQGNAVTTKYQHTDALGSPVAVTNQAGAVIERTEYAPYGAALNRPVNGVGYTGHVMDSATNLTYMQQRYYDPLIGRFLSPDPVKTDPNSGYSFNRYNYANNNPYRFTDPDGRWVEDVFIGIPSIVLGAKSAYDNTRAGNYVSAVIDVVGVVVDGVAIATPVVPGGVGIGIKASRALDNAGDAGGAAKTVGDLHLPGDVPDAHAVVRGGIGDAPATGTTYSGSHGADVAEAGRGVPNGQLRTTTAAEIRANGGSVNVKPELSRQGNMNGQHVNVVEGGTNSSLGSIQTNPAPKIERIK
jgi:RHS repeat-associated protein